MDATHALETLAISLGLGLLVGLQRERVESALAGVRTFPLITLLGTLTAMLATTFGGWVVAAGLVGVAATTAMGNVEKMKSGRSDPGVTTEVSALVMFAVGALLVTSPWEAGVAVGAGVALLLHMKSAMHKFVHQLGEKDVRAFMQFALISLVILPVLPNKAYGPFQVLNPHNIWLMVVLVVGMSLGGYMAYKSLGPRAGSVIAGLLGGAISSTATTVSYARRTVEAPELTQGAAAVVLLATMVMYVRVLLEISLVAPQFFPLAAWPVGIMLAATAAIGFAMWFGARNGPGEMPEQSNPTELKSALCFGGIYALVLVASAAAHLWFEERGLYAVAAISGLTNMDAITLSTGRFVQGGTLSPAVGWRTILIASMANMVFKTAVIAWLGHRGLLIKIAIAFGGLSVLALGLMIFWPTGAG